MCVSVCVPMSFSFFLVNQCCVFICVCTRPLTVTLNISHRFHIIILKHTLDTLNCLCACLLKVYTWGLTGIKMELLSLNLLFSSPHQTVCVYKLVCLITFSQFSSFRQIKTAYMKFWVSVSAKSWIT